VIGVAVLASGPTAQARLEALVAAHPGLQLTSSPNSAATSGDHATESVLDADVVLIDLGARPLETVLRFLPQAPRLPPVVLLADDLPRTALVRLLHSGVRAILPRDASAPEIAAGIEAVAVGLVVFHPSAAPVSVTKAAGGRRARDEIGTGSLTPRELEILTMMAEGIGNRAIAQRLGISTHTVKFHIAAILDKLNARSRTEAVTIGMRLGLLMV
jgi:NarL family two-component system response regulator YdfI